MVAGDMEAYTEELYDEALAGSGPFLCAMGRGVSGCWRCGDKEHLRRDCPQSPSEAEQQGRPMNAWAKMGPRTAAPVRTTGVTIQLSPKLHLFLRAAWLHGGLWTGFFLLYYGGNIRTKYPKTSVFPRLYRVFSCLYAIRKPVGP